MPPGARGAWLLSLYGFPIPLCIASQPVVNSFAGVLSVVEGSSSTKDAGAVGPFSVIPVVGEILARYQEGIYFPHQVPKVINLIFL